MGTLNTILSMAAGIAVGAAAATYLAKHEDDEDFDELEDEDELEEIPEDEDSEESADSDEE